jgi:hypothetical protein
MVPYLPWQYAAQDLGKCEKVRTFVPFLHECGIQSSTQVPLYCEIHSIA